MMMCIGREEKEAGDALQEEAISAVAEEREKGQYLSLGTL